MNLLPTSWQTERLLVRDATHADVPHLLNVFNACSYVGKWDSTFYEVTEEAIVQLVSKSLFLDRERKELFKMQSVFLRGTQDIIGYFHLYHDTPRPGVVWISMFVLHPGYQRSHFGSELVYGLLEQLCQMGDIQAVWLRVFLKNWPALRFWIEAGFTTIIRYDGDPVHAEDTYASITLEKKLA